MKEIEIRIIKNVKKWQAIEVRNNSLLFSSKLKGEVYIRLKSSSAEKYEKGTKLILTNVKGEVIKTMTIKNTRRKSNHRK
jgi:hypothetical protein